MIIRSAEEWNITALRHCPVRPPIGTLRAFYLVSYEKTEVLVEVQDLCVRKYSTGSRGVQLSDEIRTGFEPLGDTLAALERADLR